LTLFALDANAIIHAFQGKGRVGERLAATTPSRIAIPAIALFEVERGVLRSRNAARRRQQLADLVSVCRVLAFDERTAQIAARIQFELERDGKQIGPLDTLIAATAMAYATTLVTNNTGEFGRVPGLLLEDWF
jgi:tRNA(fMet)-specific endonuclease VapC